jgi:hypothetical protein
MRLNTRTDEYGGTLTDIELLSQITNRSRIGALDITFDYDANSAERGPRGLVRAIIDGRHCIGHGEGTWDLIIGEFS